MTGHRAPALGQLDLLDLVPVCVLPGCTTPVDDPTQPCPGCEQACAGYLQRSPGAQGTLTAEDIERRDAAIREALRQHTRKPAVRNPDQPERRANQRCWLCEDRRTCTGTPSGWECDSCLGGR